MRVVTLKRLLQLLLFVGPIRSPRAQQGRRADLGRGVGGVDPCCGVADRRPAICRHRGRGWTSERWHVCIVVRCCVESSCQGWIGREARVSHSGSGTGKRVWNEEIREECDVSTRSFSLCDRRRSRPGSGDSREAYGYALRARRGSEKRREDVRRRSEVPAFVDLGVVTARAHVRQELRRSRVMQVGRGLVAVSKRNSKSR